MPMEQQKIDGLLLKIQMLLAAVMVVAQTLGLDDLTSYVFLATFPMTVLLWLRTVRQRVTALDLLMVLTVALAALSVLINASATATGLGFGYIKKLIIFAVTMMFLQTANRLRIKGDVARFLHLLVDILVLYLIVIYFLLNIRMYLINGRVSAYLTFNMDNPNLTALFLTCLYMLEMYRLFSPERWYAKLLHVAMAVFLAFFVVQTQSRNCLVVLVLFTLVCAWLIFKGSGVMKLGVGRSALIALFPALFMGVYFIMLKTPSIRQKFDFLVSEGKGLDSRTRIWEPALDHLIGSPVVGAYSQISNGTGVSQMHNTHLDVACSYGIPVLILVCVLLWHYLHQQDRHYTDKASYIYMLAFACAIILGIGEAALFSGGLGLYIFVGSLLLLSGYTEEVAT